MNKEKILAGVLATMVLAGATDKTLGHSGPGVNCVANLKQLDGAKAQWAIDNRVGRFSELNDRILGWEPAKVPTEADLIGRELYLKLSPVCSLGGTYVIGTVYQVPCCTIHGELGRADHNAGREIEQAGGLMILATMGWFVFVCAWFVSPLSSLRSNSRETLSLAAPFLISIVVLVWLPEEMNMHWSVRPSSVLVGLLMAGGAFSARAGFIQRKNGLPVCIIGILFFVVAPTAFFILSD